jgi:hypothetical protein
MVLEEEEEEEGRRSRMTDKILVVQSCRVTLEETLQYDCITTLYGLLDPGDILNAQNSLQLGACKIVGTFIDLELSESSQKRSLPNF